jgi:hypothetical protein
VTLLLPGVVNVIVQVAGKTDPAGILHESIPSETVSVPVAAVGENPYGAVKSTVKVTACPTRDGPGRWDVIAVVVSALLIVRLRTFELVPEVLSLSTFA